MDASRIFEELKAKGPGSALDELAVLIVDRHLNRPIRDAIDPGHFAQLLRSSLQAWHDSDGAEERLAADWKNWAESLSEESRPLGEAVAPALRDGITRLVEEAPAPDRELILAFLDRAPFRQLIRELLSEILVNFAQRLGSPVSDSRVAKTLSDIGRRARSRARSSSGSLGDLAGAMSEGVERQLERKAAEFADSTLSTVLQRIADYLCSPDRTADQKALRLGLLDGLWELSGTQLSRESRRNNFDSTAAIVRSSLGAWVEEGGFEDEVSGWLQARLDGMGDKNLRAVLDELGVLQPIRDHALERSLSELRALVEDEAFAAWWETLTQSPSSD